MANNNNQSAGKITHEKIKKILTQISDFPDMKKKPTQRPTARWVFFCFQGISVLLIDKTTEVVTNIIDRHQITKLLGQTILGILFVS